MNLSFEKMVALFLLLVSLGTVAGVFFFENVLGVRPCLLCLYQRLPFYALAFLGAALYFQPGWFKPMMAVCILLFLSNAGLAVYNILVENNIIEGIAGCTVDAVSVTAADLKAALSITENPSGLRSCNDVTWTLFGIPYLTLAVINTMLSFGLAVLCMLFLAFRCCIVRRFPGLQQ